MSLRATLWALDDAPVENATQVLVLLALADEAADDGRNAFPAVKRIAARARVKVRSAQYALRQLEDAGVIRKGNQAIAAAKIKRRDRRPTVYDLRLDVTWESTGKTRPGADIEPAEDTPSGVQDVHPERGAESAPGERGAISGTHGVQSHDERGAISRTDGVHAGAPDPLRDPTSTRTADPSADKSAAQGADEQPTSVDAKRQRKSDAERIARAWHDWYETVVGPPANWPHIALRNMIERALANYSEQQVRAALKALRRPCPGAREWQDALLAVRDGKPVHVGDRRPPANVHHAPRNEDQQRIVDAWQ